MCPTNKFLIIIKYSNKVFSDKTFLSTKVYEIFSFATFDEYIISTIGNKIFIPPVCLIFFVQFK